MLTTKQETNWNQALINIEEKLKQDSHSFESFFSNLKLKSVDNDSNNIYLSTTSLLVKSYLNRNNDHSRILNEAIHKNFNKNYKVNIVLNNEKIINSIKEKEVSVDQVVENTKNKTFFSSCVINPRYTFDNFIKGECNQDAFDASLMVANDPGGQFNPLFIYSKSGLGKTHLLYAIGNYVKEKYPSKNVLYITTDAFVDEYVKYASVSSNSNMSLRDFFKDIDILLVDDIQFLADKVKTSEMFFNIFNMLSNNGKQIVLTSDRMPNDLKGLQDRLVSRFGMGLTVNIKPPDTDTSLKILKNKIISHNLNLEDYDEEGLIFLAETFSRNVRDLEGALNRLLFHSVQISENSKVTIQDIKQAVDIMVPNLDKSTSYNEDEIIDIVGKYYNITSSQIKSNSRTAQIALARRIAMYLCRVMLASSYTHIGDIFSRDHSTVMSSVEKVGNDIKTDEQLSLAIKEIKDSLKK